MSKPQALIVDLDGTLALVGDRSPYDASRCEVDALNEPVADFVFGWTMHFHESERQLILVSGRQEKDRVPTELWLEKHDIPWDALFMRVTDDQRNDAIVKRELYERHIKDQYKVYLVLDDRQRVVDMWRALGLTCWQVAASPD